MDAAPRDITRLLADLKGGDKKTLDEVMRLIYDELRSLAARYMREERGDHTLQPTALVHEAYLRMVDQKVAQWESRAHFFRMAAKVMRRILVDHARARRAAKRGGGLRKVVFTEKLEPGHEGDFDLVELDEALNGLAELSPRKSRVVELRYFTGLTAEETARVLDTPLRTVERDWTMARAWLFRELTGGS